MLSGGSLPVGPGGVRDPGDGGLAGCERSSASAAPSPAARAPVQPARWGDCGGGFLCAKVPVPSDYDNPAAGYLNISMVQLPATDRASRIGSLFVNPGGPGASGVEFVRDAAASNLFPANLRKRFDIIGFDPRGVNSSTAIRCIDNLDGQAALDPSPDDAAELRALVDSAKAYAGECGKRNDATLPYLSTAAVAHDLDTLRAAVGDEKLSYLGFSYGTLIGSSYAEQFPDHIRAMALDGAVDPALDLEGLRGGQAKAFDDALLAFLKDCAARPSCAFNHGGKSVQAFDALMARIDAKPLPARLIGDRRKVGSGNAWYARPRRALQQGVVADPGQDARAGRSRRRVVDAAHRRPVPRPEAEWLLLEPAGRLQRQHLPRLPRPDRRQGVHEVGDQVRRDRAALRRDDRVQRPGLRVLARPRRTRAAQGQRARRAADRGRRRDRRPGDAVCLVRGARQGAPVRRARHAQGRGPYRATTRATASRRRSTPTCSTSRCPRTGCAATRVPDQPHPTGSRSRPRSAGTTSRRRRSRR